MKELIIIIIIILTIAQNFIVKKKPNKYIKCNNINKFVVYLDI